MEVDHYANSATLKRAFEILVTIKHDSFLALFYLFNVSVQFFLMVKNSSLNKFETIHVGRFLLFISLHQSC